MAIANYFYNSTTRKYVALFGTLFNQLKIQRHDNAGVLKKEMIVPLAYAPYQKILARVTADPDLINSRRPAMTLPRMSFEINNISYDPQRKLTTTGKMIKRGKSETDDARPYVYNPVPYNLDFSLYIMTKYSEDATKILEQIIPFFTPDWTVGAKMIPDLDPIDIPVVLNSVTIAIVTLFKTTGISIGSKSGIILAPTVQSGVKNGIICSKILVASSEYFVIMYKEKSKLYGTGLYT